MADAQYTPYYVAFLDILGFKDQIAHSSCEKILKLYKFLGNMSEIYFGEGAGDIKK